MRNPSSEGATFAWSAVRSPKGSSGAPSVTSSASASPSIRARPASPGWTRRPEASTASSSSVVAVTEAEAALLARRSRSRSARSRVRAAARASGGTMSAARGGGVKTSTPTASGTSSNGTANQRAIRRQRGGDVWKCSRRRSCHREAWPRSIRRARGRRAQSRVWLRPVRPEPVRPPGRRPRRRACNARSGPVAPWPWPGCPRA